MQINSTKLYVSVVALSINDNIKFLGYLKQEFKRTVSRNKYRSEITVQPKSNDLDYMIHPTYRNIKRLVVLSFKNSVNDPIRSSFDEYFTSLVEIKDFNALINNKPFFDQSVKKRNKKRMKNLVKCQETMITQQET